MSVIGAPALAVIIALSAWLLALVLAPRGPAPEASGSGRVARLEASVPLIFLAAGAAVLLAGLSTVRYNDRHPRPEWMAYVKDADSSTAQWMSEADVNSLHSGIPHVDPWRSQYLTASPSTTNSPVPLPGRPEITCWAHPAPMLELAPPASELLSEVRKDTSRLLRIELRPQRGTARLTLQAQAQQILSLRVNGREMGQQRVTGAPAGSIVPHGLPYRPQDQREVWSLLFAAPPESGLEIELEVPAGSPVQLTVADISDGLPAIPGRVFSPRPSSVTLRQWADMTVVVRSFTF